MEGEERESKVERKRRKIMLKELEMVQRCIKNLKETVRGLEIIG